MQRFSNILTTALAIITVFGLAADASAQRVNAREVRDIVRSLNASVDDLGYNLTYQMRSTSSSRRAVEDARTTVENLKSSIRRFEDNLRQRRENRDDVQDIITAAEDMAGLLRGNFANRNIENAWNDITSQIDRLAANYGLTPDWNGRVSNGRAGLPSDRDDYPTDIDNGGSSSFSSTLNGTFDLDATRSETAAVATAGVRVSGNQRRDLEQKLTAPQQIAISVRGDQVTLASSNGSPITFRADGTEKTETDGGRTLRVRATLRGDELTISSLGGETDYTVTFESQDGGRSLKVMRRITTEYLAETVFAESFYNRSSEVAGLGIEDLDLPDDDVVAGGYSSNDPTDVAGRRSGSTLPNPTLSKPRIGEFLIPNGVVVTGVLENEINTKVSQNNDRFRMTVQEPLEYRGAVIEGYITGVGRSGQVSGRSNVTFNFERITLRDGKSYDFSGSVQSIKDTQGNDIRVDNEGTAQGDSQTKETAKRGGIGAGLGALIGAIAGGGKGAVLGAIIGGGAGAGSVLIGGRDDVRLMPGSTVTIQSSSPIRQDARRDN